jgi:hypothetical protein
MQPTTPGQKEILELEPDNRAMEKISSNCSETIFGSDI